jgi:hypothetical protein
MIFHRMTEPWRPAFNEASAMGIKIAVCDERGRMLACSNIAKHTAAEMGRLMGEGWHDFLQPEDMPRVLAWFACRENCGGCDGGRGCELITYQQLGKLDGKPVMQDVTLLKYWHAGVWLCYGKVEPRV